MRGASRELRATAKDLRERSTAAERVLWGALRNRQLDGIRFRRQHPIGQVILDFYCPSIGLIVEVDGGVHDEQVERDQARDAALRDLGYHTLRIRNEEVLDDLPAVLARISAVATRLGHALPPGNASPPRPLAGEGAGG